MPDDFHYCSPPYVFNYIYLFIHSFIFIHHVCVHVYTYVLQHACRRQRATYRSWSFTSIMWLKLSSAGLVANTFTSVVLSSAYFLRRDRSLETADQQALRNHSSLPIAPRIPRAIIIDTCDRTQLLLYGCWRSDLVCCTFFCLTHPSNRLVVVWICISLLMSDVDNLFHMLIGQEKMHQSYMIRQEINLISMSG